MIVFTCIILLILAITVFFLFSRKIRILSYKTTFITLVIFLLILGYFFIKVIYKTSNKDLPSTEPPLTHEYENSVSSQNDLNLYRSKSVIIVGSVAKMPPWSYKENNIILGYNIDLIKSAVKLMGKKIRVVLYDNEKDLYSALLHKKIDIIVDFNLLEKDNNQFTYSNKIVNVPFVFIANNKNYSKLVNTKKDIKLPFENFSNKTIVVENISLFISSLYDVLGKNINLVVLSNSKDVLSSIEKNKFEFGFVEYFSFEDYKHKHPNSNLIIVSSLISIKDMEGFGFIVNSDDLILLEQLNIALSLLKRRGDMSRISIKYFQKDVTL